MAELSEAKKRANKRWNDANMTVRYDRVQLVLPKGRKADIQAHAETTGESVNGFVSRAIDETMTSDKSRLEGAQTGQEGTT